MFLGSGPMSLLGVATAGWLAASYGDSVQSALSYAIGAALILGAIGLVLKTFVKRGVQPSEAGFVTQRRDKVLAVVIGAVFGYIVVLGLAGVLALSGIKLLNVPQAGYVIAVGVGLGLGAFAVWLLLQSRSREADRADHPRAGVADGDGDGFRGDAALEARAEPDLADARR
jgi:uncharacterized protein YacL